jgi:valyl-tRNA synthetase
LRLFAPFLPYVTDEVWSWWREGSIHRAEWPDPKELEAASADPAEYEVAAWALGEIRKTKALAKRSLRTDVDLVVVCETPEHLTFLRGVERDVAEAGKVRSFEYVEATEPSVEVRLAPED